jgi:hypothetical protein
MKNKDLYRPAAVLSGAALLVLSFIAASPASAQDKKEQKATTVVTASKGKDKKEKKVTVYAKSDSGDKDGKLKVHIIREENGKKTEIDTVIDKPGGLDGADLDNLMKDMHVRIKSAESDMKEAEDEMKNIQIYINGMDDSIKGDSAGKCRRMYKLVMPGCCPGGHSGNSPHAFNYNFEIPEMPELPDADEELENEFFNRSFQAPRVFAMPGKGESLSDVLGNIPMSRVKSYKIIDKKGGKRIIIDVQDGPDFSGNNVIYINGRNSHARPPRGKGHQKEMQVIIQSGDDEGAAVKPESATPPAPPKKSESNSPKI